MAAWETAVGLYDIKEQAEALCNIRKLNKAKAKVPLAYCVVYGCQQNEADMEHIRGMLREAGYGFTNTPENADCIVVNTCAVREGAEMRVLGNVGAFKKIKEKNPELIICICGCMMQQPQVVDKIKRSFYYVDIVFGTHNIENFPFLLLKKLKGQKRVFEVFEGSERIAEGMPVLRSNPYSAKVTIMYGCNNFCSYCIVPYTRGRERSREAQSILNELADLQAKGFKEVTLLGQNVNSYNYIDADGNATNFAALLAMVAEAAPDMRVRFTTSHPKDMSDEIIATIARYPNVCNHIHLPVQSGSNSVLKNMNRRYTREWYLDRIAAIRHAIPDCGISTDMFTGFYDESEEDFQLTLDLMREVGFDASFMFKYSERPGTMASKHMPDNIAEDVKIDRLNRMIALQNELSLESNRKDIGKTFDVLVEGVSKRSKEQFVGRTQQNKTCVFPRGNYRVGDIVNVRVLEVSSATLICELVEN